MGARYFIVDVFTSEPFAGNALAVFPDIGSIPLELMQTIAREMNLSETTFVTGTSSHGYDVRIFTPYEEMPFAGHPTLGTSWVLRQHLRAFAGDRVIQRSAAGETPIQFHDDLVWLERTGTVHEDHDTHPIVDVLGVSAGDLGFDSAEIGAPSASLAPAVSDAGVPQLMVPFSDPKAITALEPGPAIADLAHDGVYCFAPIGFFRVKARFFASGLGIVEDPATGSAAAALGLYLGARAGACSFTIDQGAEIRRPSTIRVEAEPGRARVGGSVRLVSEGTLYLE